MYQKQPRLVSCIHDLVSRQPANVKTIGTLQDMSHQLAKTHECWMFISVTSQKRRFDICNDRHFRGSIYDDLNVRLAG